MIYEKEYDCPNKLYVPNNTEPTTEVLIKIPVDESMQTLCSVFDVGTIFKKKRSKGLTLTTDTSSIDGVHSSSGVDLVFDTDTEFSAWDNAILKAQEMNGNKENYLKQARDTLKKEYAHEYESLPDQSSELVQLTCLTEAGGYYKVYFSYMKSVNR